MLIEETIITTFGLPIFLVKEIQKSENSNPIVYCNADNTLWKRFQIGTQPINDQLKNG